MAVVSLANYRSGISSFVTDAQKYNSGDGLTPGMWVRANFHTHERRASADATDSLARMLNAYQREGYRIVGVVGHNERPSMPPTRHPNQSEMVVTRGVERGAGSGRDEPHVIEYPGADLSILAHPGLTWPEDTKHQARRYIRQHNIDAVEKYRAGTNQYSGRIEDVVELGGDDAHSRHGVGTSYTLVWIDTDQTHSITPQRIGNAVKAGRVRPVNHRVSVVHELRKGLAVARMK